MCRNGFFNMVYFGFYHSAKNYSPQAADKRLGNPNEYILYTRVHQFSFFCEFQKYEYGVCLPRVLEEEKFIFIFLHHPRSTLALYSTPTLRISTDQEKNIF